MKVTPTIYLIAGANGVGKTTFAREFLPKEVNCLRFMNADEVARGLSPFAPEAASIRAGRVLIGEIANGLLLLRSDEELIAVRSAPDQPSPGPKN